MAKVTPPPFMSAQPPAHNFTSRNSLSDNVGIHYELHSDKIHCLFSSRHTRFASRANLSTSSCLAWLSLLASLYSKELISLWRLSISIVPGRVMTICSLIRWIAIIFFINSNLTPQLCRDYVFYFSPVDRADFRRFFSKESDYLRKSARSAGEKIKIHPP